MALREYSSSGRGDGTPVVQVSTPSYRGTHAEGFRSAVRSAAEALAKVDNVTGVLIFFRR
jgi:nitrogenase molybdenum-iron protein alpha/beta subunit